jgi:hypothetical protein
MRASNTDEMSGDVTHTAGARGSHTRTWIADARRGRGEWGNTNTQAHRMLAGGGTRTHKVNSERGS